MYEVFDPRDGQTQYTVDSLDKAKRIAAKLGLDYAKAGEGWVNDYKWTLEE